jgi:hypothetical protein
MVSSVPDFTALTSVEAQRRVRQLAAAGWADSNIAAVMGWSVADVCRALTPDSESDHAAH